MAVEIDGASKGLVGAFVVFTLGSGIATLAYGVLLLLRYLGIEYNYGIFNLFSTSILLTVVGGLLIITVLLGVLGVLKDIANVRLVTLVLLFISFAILAGVGIYGMVSYKTGRLQKSIELEVDRLNKNYKDSSPDLKKQADYLNQNYNCCGSYSTYDARANGVGIPESCCIVPGCGSEPLNNKQAYFEKGCASVYFETKATAVFHLAILALAAAGAVLLALIFYAVISQRARGGYAAVTRG